MGISPPRRAVCRAAASLDRTPAGASTRTRRAAPHVRPRRREGVAPAGRARVARTVAPVGRALRPSGNACKRTESALALGIVLTIRAHLPQLATRPDARRCARLCFDSRVDAPAEARSLAPFLAPRRARLSQLRAGSEVAARKQTLAHRRLRIGRSGDSPNLSPNPRSPIPDSASAITTCPSTVPTSK